MAAKRRNSKETGSTLFFLLLICCLITFIIYPVLAVGLNFHPNVAPLSVLGKSSALHSVVLAWLLILCRFNAKATSLGPGFHQLAGTILCALAALVFLIDLPAVVELVTSCFAAGYCLFVEFFQIEKSNDKDDKDDRLFSKFQKLRNFFFRLLKDLVLDEHGGLMSYGAIILVVCIGTLYSLIIDFPNEETREIFSHALSIPIPFLHNFHCLTGELSRLKSKN